MQGRDATNIKMNAQVSFHLMALNVLVNAIQAKKSFPLGKKILHNVKYAMISLLKGEMENTALVSPTFDSNLSSVKYNVHLMMQLYPHSIFFTLVVSVCKFFNI